MSGTGRLMIQLENGSIFSPGQQINVTVLYCPSENETIHKCYVIIKGFGKVSWRADDDSRCMKETYVDVKIPIEVGQRNPKPGQNLYHFGFILPYDIPSSYEYKSSYRNVSRTYVRYTMQAVMSFKNQRFLTAKILFVVDDGVVDLNRNEAALIVPTSSVSKTGTVTSGKVQVDTWCDRSGFIPGDTINFEAKIVCSGGRTLRGYEVRLVQYTTLIDYDVRFKMPEVLWNHAEFNISNTDFTRLKIPVVIPKNIPLSGKLHCKIIEIVYAVELIVDSGLFTRNLISSFQILIGNVPLMVRSTRPSTENHSDSGAVLFSSPASFNNHEKQSEGRQSVQFPTAYTAITSTVLPVVTVTGTDGESPPPTYESCVENNGFPFDDEVKF